MRRYYRVMLGKASAHAQDCFGGGFIGSGFGGLERDLSLDLPPNWREFNSRFIPELQKAWPDKSRITLGLWCGSAWTICKGMQLGDVVLCPDGSGTYRVGEVSGDYFYAAGGVLPHRRAVNWLTLSIPRSEMSLPLRNSTGSVGTLSEVTPYSTELEQLISGVASTAQPSIEIVEDLASFALEKHLEEFLVTNWGQTELGKEYDIYAEDGALVGQQYPTDTGPMDVLAISKDRKTLLVVELKKGRASDAVVGQTLRYMGYVQEELAEESQSVRGAVIALEDDQRIRRALKMTPSIDFYRYQISFKLLKA